MNNKQKWIIDTDPGFDDLMAILYLLNKSNTEILMLSTVDGNASIHKTTLNARKIIKWSGKNVPIYKGTETPILKTFSNEVSWFYADGLGDIDEIRDFIPDDIKIEKEHSALKMIELVEKYPNQINILLIGPITNLAVASMLYPDICDKFKNIYMMGGSLTSKGNENVCMGEFNFNYDYIATKIVFDNFKNIILTPWEPPEAIAIRSQHIEEIKKKLDESEEEYNKHTHKVTKLIVDKFTKDRNEVVVCDLYCAMTAFDNKCVKKFSLCKVDTMIDSTVNYGMLFFKSRKNVSEDFFLFKEDVFKKMCGGTDYHLVIEEMNHENIIREIEIVLREEK